MTILSDLAAALEHTPVLPRDALAVAVLQRYARALDECFDDLGSPDAIEDRAAHARVVLEIARLGARLEAMLDRLGMAPSARPALPKTGEPSVDPATAALDQLRRDSAAGTPASGVDYATSVDPSVTEADAED